MSATNLILRFWRSVARKDAARIATLPVAEADVVETDVPYLPDGDAMHTLDIYRPKGATGVLPVLVDVHGGGWYYGDKQLNAPFCRALTQYGFAVVSVSYRLAPGTDVRGQLSDVLDALRFVGQHAEGYALDVERLFLVGDSAGGHLAALAAEVCCGAPLGQDFDSRGLPAVRGLGLICPATDPCDLPLPAWAANLYFNPIFGKGYRKNGLGTRLSFTANLTEGMCPCFFITAYGDFLRKAVRRSYQAACRQGVRAVLVDPDAPQEKEHELEHVFSVSYWHWPESQSANAEMCRFFHALCPGAQPGA